MRQWKSDAEHKQYSSKVAIYVHIALQLECYADDTGDNSVYNTPGFKTLEDLRKNYESLNSSELLSKAGLVIKQFNETIDKLGRDKFITYENGDVEYIWKK